MASYNETMRRTPIRHFAAPRTPYGRPPRGRVTYASNQELPLLQTPRYPVEDPRTATNVFCPPVMPCAPFYGPMPNLPTANFGSLFLYVPPFNNPPPLVSATDGQMKNRQPAPLAVNQYEAEKLMYSADHELPMKIPRIENCEGTFELIKKPIEHFPWREPSQLPRFKKPNYRRRKRTCSDLLSDPRHFYDENEGEWVDTNVLEKLFEKPKESAVTLPKPDCDYTKVPMELCDVIQSPTLVVNTQPLHNETNSANVAISTSSEISKSVMTELESPDGDVPNTQSPGLDTNAKSSPQKNLADPVSTLAPPLPSLDTIQQLDTLRSRLKDLNQELALLTQTRDDQDFFVLSKSMLIEALETLLRMTERKLNKKSAALLQGGVVNYSKWEERVATFQQREVCLSNFELKGLLNYRECVRTTVNRVNQCRLSLLNTCDSSCMDLVEQMFKSIMNFHHKYSEVVEEKMQLAIDEKFKMPQLPPKIKTEAILIDLTENTDSDESETFVKIPETAQPQPLMLNPPTPPMTPSLEKSDVISPSTWTSNSGRRSSEISSPSRTPSGVTGSEIIKLSPNISRVISVEIDRPPSATSNNPACMESPVVHPQLLRAVSVPATRPSSRTSSSVNGRSLSATYCRNTDSERHLITQPPFAAYTAMPQANARPLNSGIYRFQTQAMPRPTGYYGENQLHTTARQSSIACARATNINFRGVARPSATYYNASHFEPRVIPRPPSLYPGIIGWDLSKMTATSRGSGFTYPKDSYRRNTNGAELPLNNTAIPSKQDVVPGVIQMLKDFKETYDRTGQVRSSELYPMVQQLNETGQLPDLIKHSNLSWWEVSNLLKLIDHIRWDSQKDVDKMPKQNHNYASSKDCGNPPVNMCHYAYSEQPVNGAKK